MPVWKIIPSECYPAIWRVVPTSTYADRNDFYFRTHNEACRCCDKLNRLHKEKEDKIRA
jgi:hypothetical protein